MAKANQINHTEQKQTYSKLKLIDLKGKKIAK